MKSENPYLFISTPRHLIKKIELPHYNLSFSEAGEKRLMQLLGFLSGVWERDRDTANALFDSFTKCLKYICWEGTYKDSTIPATMVYLSDDGQFGDFFITWARASETAGPKELANERRSYKGQTVFFNVYMVGGLIYHCQDDVTKGSWSTHT